MALLLLGNPALDTILESDLGSGGDPSVLRPGVVRDISAYLKIPRPPVGYRAFDPVPATNPLVITYTVVADASGYTVTLTLPNNIAPMFWTIDGSVPVAGAPSNLYRGPFRVTGASGAQIHVKFKAFAATGLGFTDSVVYDIPVTIP